MKIQIGGAILASSLVAGCATYPPQAVYIVAKHSDVSRDENRCTDIISTVGGVLKFCQTKDDVNIYESGIDPTAERRKLDIVNDPNALLALQKRINVRPDLRESRNLVAKACIVNDTRYVTISLDSLNKILDANGPTAIGQAASPNLGDQSTDPRRIASVRSDMRYIGLTGSSNVRSSAWQQ